MNWVDIGTIEDIPVRGSRVVKTAIGCIGVFRTDDDAVYAVSNTCPHRGGPLSDGIVHGHSVTCPLHNMVFDLATGEAQGADEGRIDTFPLRVDQGRLLLDTTAMGRHRGAA